jgi:hypothetical protein
MIRTKPKDTQLEEIARQAAPAKSDGKETLLDHGGLFDGGKKPAVKVKPELKQDAATKILQEGVTGKDHGADEAMAKLPHINVPKDGNNK